MSSPEYPVEGVKEDHRSTISPSTRQSAMIALDALAQRHPDDDAHASSDKVPAYRRKNGTNKIEPSQERHTSRHREDLDPLPPPPMPIRHDKNKPAGRTSSKTPYSENAKRNREDTMHEQEKEFAQEIPATEFSPRMDNEHVFQEKRAAYHKSDRKQFAQEKSATVYSPRIDGETAAQHELVKSHCFAEEMPVTVCSKHTDKKHILEKAGAARRELDERHEFMHEKKRAARHELDEKQYFAEEMPPEEYVSHTDDDLIHKYPAFAHLRAREEAMTATGGELPRETPHAASPTGHEASGSYSDVQNTHPGAYRIEGFASFEDVAEEGFSFTGEDTVTPAPEGIEPEETLVVAAKVVRSESDVAEEAKQRIMEEAQMADVVPPEKFFSLKNRKLMITLAGIALIILGLVLGLTFSLQDNGSDPETLPSVPPEFVRVLSPVSGEEPLLDPLTPQYEAAMWLAWNDTALLDPETDSETEIQQRYIMVLLYIVLNGAEWLNHFSFLSDSNACEWNDELDYGVFCDEQNFVSQINLDSNNLVGWLPNEIAFLQQLRMFSMRNNTLSGSIMPSIGRLSKLAHFDVYLNGLTGSIPESIFSLSNLSLLRLGTNRIDGSISSNIGNLSSLISFDSSQCELKGQIPSEIFSLERLEELYLHVNKLTGILFPLYRAPNLRIVDLHDNDLIGELAIAVSAAPNLVRLDVSFNRFSGALPDFSSNLDRLELFSAEANELTGNVVNFFATAPHSLQQLLMYQNGLSGSLPSSVGEYTVLRHLVLNANHFTGTIPTEIGLLPLEVLSLFDNDIVGTIPTEVGASTNLTAIMVHQNNLQGTIPQTIGDLPLLDYLLVAENDLSGTLPDFSANQEGLIGMFAHGNTQLSGRLERLIASHPRLQALSLGNTRISGSIPNVVGGLSDLTTLYLDGSRITGTLPSEIGHMTKLRYFGIPDNRFTGTLPTEIGMLSELIEFLAGGNSFHGNIPSELGKCANLSSLGLANNRLTGSIPQAVGNLPALWQLSMGHNFLHSHLPDFSPNKGVLAEFSAENNTLSGDVEIFFSSISSTALRAVILQFNQFTGKIPPSIGNYVEMQELMLGHNFLSGSIPSELGLTDLIQLRLDDNDLTGGIPSELGNCSNLQFLYLYANSLTGTVPDSIASLPLLDTFVVPWNDLSGDLNAFCERHDPLSSLMADCLAPPEIICNCCQLCCNDTNCCDNAGNCAT